MGEERPVRAVGIRLHAYEDEIINQACEALNGLPRSTLMQEAVLTETARLGIRWSAEEPAYLGAPWPYMPERGEEATEVRVNVSMSMAVCELLRRGAAHVHASEPQFVVGATLAYVGRLQRLFKGVSAETPGEAAKIRDALQRIKLPSQYQYRGRRRR